MDSQTRNRTTQWHEIRRVFDAALDVAPGARGPFVDDAARDVGVRHAVLRLLAIHDDYAGDETSGDRPVLDAALDAVTARFGLRPGDEIGGFRVERRLGEGGMGSVYLATRSVGDGTQRVALKIVAHTARDGRFGERLRRERAILAGLDHPNIARLIDAGELSDGRPYFAMEFVDGEPVTHHCDRRSLGLPARLDLFLAVCAAVAYAHRRLVLHRDLKPGNILVDDAGRVRLLDFGIATAIDDIAGTSAATLDGSFFSPDCAAPEQVDGRPTNTATDVYGLGCLLYELLCGRTPLDFSGLSRTQTIAAILRDEPVPVSRSLVRPVRGEQSSPWLQRSYARASDLAAALRGDLDAIVAKALRKRPDDRYESVDALAADVRSVLQSRPIALRSRERRYRAGRFVRRHRLSLGIAAFVGVVVVALTAAALVQSRRAVDALALAEQQRDHARGVTDFLVAAFDEADPLRTRGRELRAGELLESAARSQSAGASVGPELRATIAQTLAHMFFRLAIQDAAKTQIEVARTAIAQIAQPPAEMLANQYLVEGELALVQNRYRDAERNAADGLALFGDYPALRDGDLEIKLAMLKTNAVVGYGDTPQAMAFSRATLARLQTRTDIALEKLEPLTLSLARRLANNNRPDEARAMLEAQLAAQRQRLPEDHPTVIGTMQNLATALYRLRRTDVAIEYLEPALRNFVRIYGENHRVANVMMTELGEMYAFVGRVGEGEQLLRKALRGNGDGRFGKRDNYINYERLTLIYRDQLGDLDGAERMSWAALAVLSPESARDYGYVYRSLAETLIAQERYFEAEYYAGIALPVLRANCADCQQAAYLMADLAWIRFRRYDLDGAAQWLAPDVLTTLRVYSRSPHRVWQRAEEVARVVGVAWE